MHEIWTSRQPAATAKAGFARGPVMSALADLTVGLGSPTEYRCAGARVPHRTINPAEHSEGVSMT
jgi:hypothetical protein